MSSVEGNLKVTRENQESSNSRRLAHPATLAMKTPFESIALRCARQQLTLPAETPNVLYRVLHAYFTRGPTLRLKRQEPHEDPELGMLGVPGRHGAGSPVLQAP